MSVWRLIMLRPTSQLLAVNPVLPKRQRRSRINARVRQQSERNNIRFSLERTTLA